MEGTNSSGSSTSTSTMGGRRSSGTSKRRIGEVACLNRQIDIEVAVEVEVHSWLGRTGEPRRSDRNGHHQARQVPAPPGWRKLSEASASPRTTGWFAWRLLTARSTPAGDHV